MVRLKRWWFAAGLGWCAAASASVGNGSAPDGASLALLPAVPQGVPGSGAIVVSDALVSIPYWNDMRPSAWREELLPCDVGTAAQKGSFEDADLRTLALPPSPNTRWLIPYEYLEAEEGEESPEKNGRRVHWDFGARLRCNAPMAVPAEGGPVRVPQGYYYLVTWSASGVSWGEYHVASGSLSESHRGARPVGISWPGAVHEVLIADESYEIAIRWRLSRDFPLPAGIPENAVVWVRAGEGAGQWLRRNADATPMRWEPALREMSLPLKLPGPQDPIPWQAVQEDADELGIDLIVSGIARNGILEAQLPAGDWDVSFAPGRDLMWINTGEVSLTVPEATSREVPAWDEPPEFRTGHAWHGVVHDPGGRPVAAAEVHCDCWSEDGDVREIVRRVASAGDGSFAIRGLLPAECTVEVTKDGFLDVRGRNIPFPGEDLDVELTPGAYLVPLWGEQGPPSPLAGMLEAQTEDGWADVGDPDWSDARGIGPLWPGCYRLTLQGPGRRIEPEEVCIAVGETVGLEMRHARRSVVRIHFRNPEGGAEPGVEVFAPCDSGCMVFESGQIGESPWPLTSDADGIVELPCSPLGAGAGLIATWQGMSFRVAVPESRGAVDGDIDVVLEKPATVRVAIENPPYAWYGLTMIEVRSPTGAVWEGAASPCEAGRIQEYDGLQGERAVPLVFTLAPGRWRISSDSESWRVVPDEIEVFAGRDLDVRVRLVKASGTRILLADELRGSVTHFEPGGEDGAFYAEVFPAEGVQALAFKDDWGTRPDAVLRFPMEWLANQENWSLPGGVLDLVTCPEGAVRMEVTLASGWLVLASNLEAAGDGASTPSLGYWGKRFIRHLPVGACTVTWFDAAGSSLLAEPKMISPSLAR